jgi:hypothetical protein
MSVLKTLKLADAKPVHNVTAKDRGRAKLINYLDEQRALVSAQLEGKTFQATKTVFRTGEAGERVRVEAVRNVRRGWFTDAAGTLFFQIRYGAKPLELAKGMTAIQVETVEALPATIDTIKQAVTAGELDAVLAAAAVERKKNFKRKPVQA